MSTPGTDEPAKRAVHELRQLLVGAIVDSNATNRTAFATLGRMLEDMIMADGPTLRVALDRVAEINRVMKDNVRNRHHALARLRK